MTGGVILGRAKIIHYTSQNYTLYRCSLYYWMHFLFCGESLFILSVWGYRT